MTKAATLWDAAFAFLSVSVYRRNRFCSLFRGGVFSGRRVSGSMFPGRRISGSVSSEHPAFSRPVSLRGAPPLSGLSPFRGLFTPPLRASSPPDLLSAGSSLCRAFSLPDLLSAGLSLRRSPLCCPPSVITRCRSDGILRNPPLSARFSNRGPLRCGRSGRNGAPNGRSRG